LPDKPAYARFERAIVAETKEIVMPVCRASRAIPENLDTVERYFYMRVSYNIKSTDLAEFQARLEESVIPFAKEHGWYLGDAYLGVTGVSGAVTQMWLVPERSIGLAATRLAKTEWQGLLSSPPEVRFLDPLAIDPSVGRRTAAK